MGKQFGVDPGSAIELVFGEIETVNCTWAEFSKSKCRPYCDAAPYFQQHIRRTDLQVAKDDAVEVGLALSALAGADEPGREIPPILSCLLISIVSKIGCPRLPSADPPSAAPSQFQVTANPRPSLVTDGGGPMWTAPGTWQPALSSRSIPTPHQGAAMPTMTTTMSHPTAAATSSMDDLCRRVDDADPAAWAEIMRRYGTLVSATVRSFRLQEADALDAVQMTWLRLAENGHQIKFPERLGGWLATTARRECLHILRQAKRGPNLTDVAAETVADSSVGPEQRVIDADITRTLWQLVDELSPRRATLIRMLFADNPRCYAEVSQVAGTPVGGIGPTRARALQELRVKLDQHERAPRARR